MKINKKDESKNNSNIQETNENGIEIVIGDESELDISNVGDYMNTLKPQIQKKPSKGIVIPKSKKETPKK